MSLSPTGDRRSAEGRSPTLGIVVFAIPPRGPALAWRRWLLSFDVDCGELVAGHRFVARGLQDDGPLDPADWGVEPVGADGGVHGASLEYELAPGVPAEAGDGPPFPYLAGMAYAADVPLPWEASDDGVIANFAGEPTTHGSRGPWPVPSGATVLTFTLFPVDGSGFPSNQAAGELVVDLVAGSARWLPMSQAGSDGGQPP